MVLLPKQIDRLATIAEQTGRAIGIAQTGSIVRVDTGKIKFSIDADGFNVTPPNPDQEKLC